MNRQRNRLTTVSVKNLTKPGLHGDGGGLYLQISKVGRKQWVYRFQAPGGRRRDMGLGNVVDVSLQEAREEVAKARALRRKGLDPIEERKSRRLQAVLESAQAITFDRAAAGYIEAHRHGWTNAVHASQWETTLRVYASPIFGNLPVADVDTRLVLRALSPIWLAKTETASRVRARIELILDWAAVQGYRTGENPARWKGHLDKLLPKPSKVRSVVHHPALPYQDLPELMDALQGREGSAARCLEFTILTAARTGESTKAEWAEFDLDNRLWTVPGERMKAGREHRVPLSSQAMRIIVAQKEISTCKYLFPSPRYGKHLSNMAMSVLLNKRMAYRDVTVHGFRSSFRDWVAERTSYPGEVAEAALAHVVGDRVEAAYRRGDLFEKRRHMMEAWGTYGYSPAATCDVVPIRKTAIA